MKRPNKPSEPQAPFKPIMPLRKISSRINISTSIEDESLFDIIECVKKYIKDSNKDIQDINSIYENCKFEKEYEFYGDSSWTNLVYYTEIDNPSFEAEMIRYNKSMEEYQKRKIVYDERIEKFNKEYEQYDIDIKKYEEYKDRENFERLKKKFETKKEEI